MQGFVTGTGHFSCEIGAAITGSLRTDQASAPVQTLSGQDSGKFVGKFLVRTKQVTDFPGSDTNVAGWDIGIWADMTKEFRHEALAKPHNFIV